MTTEVTSTQPTESQTWYARLDRFLLFWTAGEFGYLILLFLELVVLVIIGLTDNTMFTQLHPEDWIIWPNLLLVVAMLVNLVTGFAGLILNIATRHKGYPGTGHLLNWIFIFASFWLFVVLFLVVAQQFLYSIF